MVCATDNVGRRLTVWVTRYVDLVRDNIMQMVINRANAQTMAGATYASAASRDRTANARIYGDELERLMSPENMHLIQSDPSDLSSEERVRRRKLMENIEIIREGLGLPLMFGSGSRMAGSDKEATAERLKAAS